MATQALINKVRSLVAKFHSDHRVSFLFTPKVMYIVPGYNMSECHMIIPHENLGLRVVVPEALRDKDYLFELPDSLAYSLHYQLKDIKGKMIHLVMGQAQSEVTMDFSGCVSQRRHHVMWRTPEQTFRYDTPQMNHFAPVDPEFSAVLNKALVTNLAKEDKVCFDVNKNAVSSGDNNNSNELVMHNKNIALPIGSPRFRVKTEHLKLLKGFKVDYVSASDDGQVCFHTDIGEFKYRSSYLPADDSTLILNKYTSKESFAQVGMLNFRDALADLQQRGYAKGMIFIHRGFTKATHNQLQVSAVNEYGHEWSNPIRLCDRAPLFMNHYDVFAPALSNVMSLLTTFKSSGAQVYVGGTFGVNYDVRAVRLRIEGDDMTGCFKVKVKQFFSDSEQRKITNYFLSNYRCELEHNLGINDFDEAREYRSTHFLGQEPVA